MRERRGEGDKDKQTDKQPQAKEETNRQTSQKKQLYRKPSDQARRQSRKPKEKKMWQLNFKKILTSKVKKKKCGN